MMRAPPLPTENSKRRGRREERSPGCRVIGKSESSSPLNVSTEKRALARAGDGQFDGAGVRVELVAPVGGHVAGEGDLAAGGRGLDVARRDRR